MLRIICSLPWKQGENYGLSFVNVNHCLDKQPPVEEKSATEESPKKQITLDKLLKREGSASKQPGFLFYERGKGESTETDTKQNPIAPATTTATPMKELMVMFTIKYLTSLLRATWFSVYQALKILREQTFAR